MFRYLFLVAAIAAPCVAAAQSSGAQKRAEELAHVQELVNDPNPQMRIANFEDIAASGDAVKLQTAVQIALSGNDAMLRGVAFRAYVAGVQRIMAELSLDPQLQKTLDRARQQDQSQYNAAISSVYQLKTLLSSGMRMDFKVLEFDVRSGRGKLLNSIDKGFKPTDFNVIGDRLVGRIASLAAYPCDYELRPTRDLQIVGSMTCQDTGFGKIAIAAPMF